MATSTEPKVLDCKMFICVDPVQNNNRFWKYERLGAPVSEMGKKGKLETGDLRVTWGRVGEAGDSQLKMWDEKFVSSKIKEKTRATKERQAYTEVKTIGAPEPARTSAASGTKVTSAAVAKAAVSEIAGGCPVTSSLVKKLAETNKHELVAATGGLAKGGMDIDLETGLVRTALGVVTLDAVKEARVVLDRMLPFVTKHDTDNLNYTNILGTYLRLVPQDVGTRKRGWHTDFINVTAQTSLLDQLETSVELAEQRMLDAVNKDVPDAPKPQAMFECKLSLVTDAGIWKRLNDAFFGTKNSAHRSVSGIKPTQAWEVTIPHHVRDFESHGRKVGNIQELWHGTRVVNCLSLLKRGYVLPGQLSSAQLCGAMFGPYLYYSDTSTKSLNYARGGVWSSGVDSVCYMFYNDVAMGREHTPRSSCSRIPAGYDSIFAKAGYSGVMNNEMVVPHTYQVNPRYLIEFS